MSQEIASDSAPSSHTLNHSATLLCLSYPSVPSLYIKLQEDSISNGLTLSLYTFVRFYRNMMIKMLSPQSSPVELWQQPQRMILP